MTAYNRRLVEQLLPAAWDSSYAYGMQNPFEPAPDMPRSKPDPKIGGTIFAHIADIKAAWRRAPVPHTERVAVIYRYGFGWTDREIAAEEGVARSLVNRRIEQGVGRLTAWLNGQDFSTNYDADDLDE